ncbi:MAG: hypothetical protein Q8Q49_02070 [bacterium]|nr:hypothetical protein [bacterium]
MDPKKPALDPKQQETLNRIMSTPTASAGTPPVVSDPPADPPKPSIAPTQTTTPVSPPKNSSPFPTFSSAIPDDPSTVKPVTPPSSTPHTQQPLGMGGTIPPSSPFVTPQAAAKPTGVKSYANIPMAQPPATTVPTVIQAPTNGTPPTTLSASQIPQAQNTAQPASTTSATSTAPTNTSSPAIGKKRSPLITVLFVILALILIVAYAIVWALVFGLTLPFALPF